MSSAQQRWALFCGIRTWMGDQKRIPRVVITSFFFFHSLSKAILKTADLPSLVWCRFFYFSTICSSFRLVRIHAYLFTTYYKYTAEHVVGILLNSLDFSSSKTITLILSPLPTKHVALDEINNMFYDFLWSGRRDKIKWDVMISDYKNGGLRMIDMVDRH